MAALLAVLFALPSIACERADFGRWQQQNYKDTRARVLERDAIGPITHRVGSSGKYIVDTGSWVDALSGEALHAIPARRVHIDHVVPIKWACTHGAGTWSREKRKAFYNDTRFLITVAAGNNMAKGAMAPNRFTPHGLALDCGYINLFLQGVAAYGLELSQKEANDLQIIRSFACRSLVAMN